MASAFRGSNPSGSRPASPAFSIARSLAATIFSRERYTFFAQLLLLGCIRFYLRVSIGNRRFRLQRFAGLADLLQAVLTAP
jgi:hypothetical protein